MPRKNCRTIVRNRGTFRLTKDTRKVSLLCLGGTWRTISQRQAEQMEAAGEAEKLSCDELGVYWAAVVRDPSRPSPTTLTRSTMEAVANAKDGRLTAAEKRQVEKFQVWALIGDTKAVCVRPRISDADRRHAEKLLGMKVAA